jgi:hypothetical protein
MVAPAPAISLHVNSRKNSKHSTSVSCDLTLSPVELVYRHRTVSNMMELVKRCREIDDRSGQSYAIDTSVEKIRHELSFSGSCASVLVSLPLLWHVDTDSLFLRRGQVYDEHVSQPSLGLRIEHISIEWDDVPSNRTDEMVVADAGLKLSCHQLLFFASSPVGEWPVVRGKIQRTDIIVARGRMEVNPYFPISISVNFKSQGKPERNYGRESFPVTPTISSFKARQEDEDDELKIDRVLFSKLQDVEADSRKELRGTDPQSTMISNAEKCEIIVAVNIPELLGDFSAKELEVLLRMVNATTSTVQTSPIETSDETDASEPLCISFNCDQVSLLLHSDIMSNNPESDVEQETSQVHSYVLVMDQFKGHTVVTGAKAQHVRVLCHEPCFYEGNADLGDGSRKSIFSKSNLCCSLLPFRKSPGRYKSHSRPFHVCERQGVSRLECFGLPHLLSIPSVCTDFARESLHTV